MIQIYRMLIKHYVWIKHWIEHKNYHMLIKHWIEHKNHNMLIKHWIIETKFEHGIPIK